VPPSFLLQKTHRSSPDRYLLPMEARRPAEALSCSRTTELQSCPWLPPLYRSIA
jgi:hypothetical protein